LNLAGDLSTTVTDQMVLAVKAKHRADFRQYPVGKNEFVLDLTPHKRQLMDNE
jgi:hypothetical protein